MRLKAGTVPSVLLAVWLAALANPAAASGAEKQYLLVGESGSFLSVEAEDFDTAIRRRLENAGAELVSYSFRGADAKNYLFATFPDEASLETFLGDAADQAEVVELSAEVPSGLLEVVEVSESPARPPEEPPLEPRPEQVPEGAEERPPDAWKRINTRWFDVLPVGGLFMDFVRFGQGETSRTQVGDLNEFETPEIRGIRAGAVGTFNFKKKPWLWAVFGAYNGFNAGFERDETPTWTLFDLWVEIPVSKLGLVTVGKAKEPFSMERMMAGGLMGYMERAVGTDAFTPSRADGISVKGVFADKRMNWAGGYYISGRRGDRGVGHHFVGRLAGLPLNDPQGKGLLHVGTAVRSGRLNSFGFRVTPEWNNAPDFVDTGNIMGDGANYLLGEIYYRRKSFFFASEHISNWVQSPQNGDPYFWSAFAQASWTVTGEGREYDHDRGQFRVMEPNSDFIAGGAGLVELGLRYSTVDLDGGMIRGGRFSRFSATANWYMKPNLITQFVWGLGRLSRHDLIGYTLFYQGRVAIIF